MENLNAETVKNALECCISGDDCTMCPLCDEQSCPCVLNENALALITSQEQRIKELAEENERILTALANYDRQTEERIVENYYTVEAYEELREENERLRAENARYEAENHAEFNKWLELEEATKRHHAELFKEAKIAVKEDTVKKMQEQLKMEIDRFGKRGGFITKETVYFFIDQIAKELVEDKPCT